MTDLFNKIISNNKKSILFPLFESWQDFAKPKDLIISKENLNCEKFSSCYTSKKRIQEIKK